MSDVVQFLCLTPGLALNRATYNRTTLRLGGEPLEYGKVYAVPEANARAWDKSGLGKVNGEEVPSIEPGAAFAEHQPGLIDDLKAEIADLRAELAAALESAESVDAVAEFRAMVDEARKGAGLAALHHRTGLAKLKEGYAEAIRELVKAEDEDA